MSKKKTYYLSLLISISAFAYLGYLLFTFQQYEELGKALQNSGNIRWILLVLLLLPLNWGIETLKWQFLTKSLQKLDFKTAIKSVLIGNMSAFITPNRLGEYPGRAIELLAENRIRGIILGFVGSIAQTITICLWGIPAAVLFMATYANGVNATWSISLAITAFIVLLCVYYALPSLAKHIAKNKHFHRYKEAVLCFQNFSFGQLSYVLWLSTLRYLTFCVQFYALLLFFNVNLSPAQAAIAIATNYLFVTFTPSIAAAEGAVRASIAVIVIGAIIPNPVNIAAAGVFIWLINYIFPMLIATLWNSKRTANVSLAN